MHVQHRRVSFNTAQLAIPEFDLRSAATPEFLQAHPWIVLSTLLQVIGRQRCGSGSGCYYKRATALLLLDHHTYLGASRTYHPVLKTDKKYMMYMGES